MDSQYFSELVIRWALTNFSLVALIIAIVFIFFHHRINPQLAESEIVYRWVSFFALGVAALYAFVIHAFFPAVAAHSIGWPTSPFQYEIAVANLAIGIIAILSFTSHFSFRLATTIAAIIWLWGDAGNHLYQLIRFHNFAPGNAGSWLMTDLVIPLILIITMGKLRYHKYHL